MRSSELEERLINFAVKIISLVNSMPYSVAGRILSQQLAKSGTSTALNYGEVLGSESRNDFVHKLKIVLKELRETHNNLRIISRGSIYDPRFNLSGLLTECNELIAIFVSSVRTASENKVKKAA